MKFRIHNKITGMDFGDYEADSEADALDAMAKDAGYADYKSACEVTGSLGEMVAVLIED